MQDDRAAEAYYREKPLRDEINRLKAELDAMRKSFRSLEAERRALRVDAAKYWMIRENSRSTLLREYGIDLDWYEPTENLDALFDEALAKGGEGK